MRKKRMIILIVCLCILFLGLGLFLYKNSKDQSADFEFKDNYYFHNIKINNNIKSIYVNSVVDLYVEYENKYGLLASDVKVISVLDKNGSRVSSTNSDDASSITVYLPYEIDNLLHKIELIETMKVIPNLSIKEYKTDKEIEVKEEKINEYVDKFITELKN